MVKCFRGIILSSFALSLFFTVFLNNEVYAEFNISVSTSGAQNIDVVPKAGESKITSIATDDLTVSTTCRAGYYLTMSASVNDNNLYLNGDSTNNTSGTYFAPADGTTTLGNSTNTWGYLMSDSAPTTSSVFLAVPTVGNAVTLKTPEGTASQTDISDDINIYFGVSASSGLTPGSYKMIKDGSNADGVITYYATMAESCNVYTITYNANGGNGSIENQVVDKGFSVQLADNAFTRSDYYFKGWATSANGAVVYRPSQSITPTSDLNLYAVWGESTNTSLYDAVESLNRGSQTVSGLRSSITKRNSGVYAYNSSTFGTSSDENNDYSIYYYRGIIDTDIGSDESKVGSSGNSYNYPNYVRLGDTCWRIFRTTGSGGVKMIYNGLFGATESGTCANADPKVVAGHAAYGAVGASGVSAWSKNLNRVGYTFNNSSSVQDTSTETSVDTVFGSNSNYSTTNTANSGAKTFLEDTWFSGAVGNFAGLMEPSAGYCNDRTAYLDNEGSTPLTTVKPYVTTTDSMYFEGFIRNLRASHTLTLTCPRGTVDLYTTKAASNGNKQLKKPVALITADERALSGNGNGSNYSSNYSNYSFLFSDTSFEMTMSPSSRGSAGFANMIIGSFGSGNFASTGVASTSESYRPVISLKHGVTPASGSGIATDPWTIEAPSIYENIASMSKGYQTNDTNSTTGIKVNPTAPTTSTPVSPNSGVYEYNSSVFGADSDGTKSDNTKATIYYYRGILDTYGNTTSYGSSGTSDAYPNYVILQSGDSKATTDTCWRIIRTTGSGGVKMIYNGLWTGSTCANATTSARITTPASTSTFNGTASTATQARQVVRVGYTHNNTYASTTSSNVAVGTLFGSDSNYSVNNTNSTIKGNIESWYNSAISEFGDMLESNANYCNDRSAFTSNTGATATSSLYSYTTTTSGANYAAYFGPYIRNITTNLPPSLGCSRSTVDRYSTSTSSGGNGQLSVPVSLLTADEASFAGSGSSTASQGSGYNANSYLRTGTTFWTLSPSYRSAYAYGFYMNANGYLASSRIDTAYSIRPVISLKEGVTPISGTGVSTDPWVVVTKPKTISDLTYLQDFANLSSDGRTSVLNSMTTGTSYILRDSRDNTEYHIAKLADGNVWLQDNLALDLTDNSVKTAMLDSNDTKTNASYSNINTLLSAVTNSSTIDSYTSPVINTNYRNNSVTKYGSGSGKVGIFYNFCAASVNVQCHQPSSTNGNDGYGLITQDVCPKGWKLPAASSNGDFQTLYDSYSDVSSFLSALSVSLSGYYHTSFLGENDYAYYISTGPAYSMNRIGFLPVLYVTPDSVSITNGIGRSAGAPIRCMLTPAS